MTDRPVIDVVMPAFNEEGAIGDTLDTVFGQDYPAELLKVWVVDAGSTDRTAEVVRERAAREPRLTLIGGRGRLNAAQALNAGIAEGSAELIARVDAHSALYPDYLSRAVEALQAEGDAVACVGAQPEQVGETPFGEAVAAARASRFGVGASVYADSRDRAYVDTVQCGVYRRAPLEEVGGFATDMLVGEDEELAWRLGKAGYKILLDTRMRFRYTTRSSWRAVFRQHRNYGQSRVRVLSAHPDYLKPYHLAPPAFVATAGALAAASTFNAEARKALAAIGAAYGGAALAAGAAASNGADGGPGRIAASFAAMHLGYGVGMLEGAAQWAAAKAGVAEPRTAVARR